MIVERYRDISEDQDNPVICCLISLNDHFLQNQTYIQSTFTVLIYGKIDYQLFTESNWHLASLGLQDHKEEYKREILASLYHGDIHQSLSLCSLMSPRPPTIRHRPFAF